MIYRNLAEYSEEELVAELTRRATLRAASLCDYCERARNTLTCKFPERHIGKGSAEERRKS